MFKNMGEHQVKELINASKLAIFFIDENQKIHIDDIGNFEVINRYAKELNSGVTTLELTSQFRCNGSDGYLAWVDDVLQIRETANVNFIGKDRSEEHTSELQSRGHLVCRLLLEKTS